MKAPIIAVVVAVIGMLFACHSAVLVADGPLNVMKEPYPAGYPSTHPMPNSVIATLHLGQRLKVKSEGYGKDFKYYKVVLPAGVSGYVIHGEGAFHVEE
jgi:hypothetical protein